jgi:hypothetical protein
VEIYYVETILENYIIIIIIIIIVIITLAREQL